MNTPTSSTPTTPTSTLLTELDVILDTRLATLIDIDPDKASDAVAKGYHDRLMDVFPGFDIGKFNERYAARKESVLRFAQATPMMDMVNDFVQKTLQQTARTPFHLQPRVEVNTWPYEISDVTADSLLAGLVHITEGQTDIQLVHYSPEQLNPAFVKHRYSVMAMYDYPTWLETHAKNKLWDKYTCPGVQLLAPMRIKDPLVTPSGDVVENFAEIERTLSPFVAVQHLPLQLFSWKFNPRKHKADTAASPKTPETP